MEGTHAGQPVRSPRNAMLFGVMALAMAAIAVYSLANADLLGALSFLLAGLGSAGFSAMYHKGPKAREGVAAAAITLFLAGVLLFAWSTFFG